MLYKYVLWKKCKEKKVHNVYFIIPVGACEKLLFSRKQNIRNNRLGFPHTHKATQ